MANSADPDQLASEANWSGSALFAKAGDIRVHRTRVKESIQVIDRYIKIPNYELLSVKCTEIKLNGWLC